MKTLWKKEKIPTRNGAFDGRRRREGAIAEVATSFPVCFLGAIRTHKKFWKTLKEEDEESSKNSKKFLKSLKRR